MEKTAKSYTPQWYILKVPQGHRDPDNKRLQAVQKKYESDSDEVFEFFAPLYVEAIHRDGKLVETHKPLYLNYVFVKCKLPLLRTLKKYGNELEVYKFLPLSERTDRDSFPFVSDVQMKYMQWVAESRSNKIPIYIPQSQQPIKGDKIRIIHGAFKGLEATVAVQPGRGQRDIFVSVDNCRFVPLTNIQEGDYEIIEYNSDNKRHYTTTYNDKLIDKLHNAIQRYHLGTLTEEDKLLAEKVRCEYGSFELRKGLFGNSNIKSNQKGITPRIYAFILPAFTILKGIESSDNFKNSANGEILIHDCEQEWKLLIGEMLGVIANQKEAYQNLALMYVTLYGCTNNIFYYEKAHKLVDPWRKEGTERKIKQQLISRLDDYDKWLGH